MTSAFPIATRFDRRKGSPATISTPALARVSASGNHIGLRDYLRAHPDVAREYGELKQALAKRFPDDIDSYIAGKTEFVLGILAKAGLSGEELEAVRRINRPAGSDTSSLG